MTAAKTPARRTGPATPSASVPDAPTARETPSAATADPGPPPHYPAPSREAMAANADLARLLFQAARGAVPVDTSRDNVRGVDVFRQPPAIQQYKAELLSWLDARDAYDRKVKKNK